ncbi:Peptidyl-prolyl cis-trans isomerase-like 2 [Sciurus carolinensis]|uniref:Peptidyl-prolyl cis-trans isomerase-like 2 n=1 Tax=Sciurus carolinensis TaxID=30640 RepID=A0AA41MVL9_SCICA|nr:Peptidyl-prolyl cis-trans isomerase-like 2 [Sciurus carolinensis]
MKAPEKKKVDQLNAAHYSTGKCRRRHTASDEDVLRHQFGKKDSVQLHSNKGDLNLNCTAT